MERITHLLPVRNGEAFISRALAQIIGLFTDGDEIIVVDDGSTDNTVRIINSIDSSKSKINLVSSKGHGLAVALNLGLKMASNTWVARYDVDDRYRPDRVSLQKQLITSETGVIFSDYSFWSESNRYLGLSPSPMNNAATILSLLSSRQTAHPSALLNRDAVMSVGGYKQDDFPAEDLGLWLRLSRECLLKSVPETLLYYQLTKSGVTGSKQKMSLSQKRRLLSNIGLPWALLESKIPELHSTFEAYSRESNESLRSLLLLMNIKKARRYNLRFPSVRDFLADLTPIGCAKVPSTILNAYYYQQLRRLAR
jgi:glycosyltransferase involved in cell wall biosynthesis